MLMFAAVVAQADVPNGSFTGSASGWELETQWVFNNNAVKGYANSGSQYIGADFNYVYNNYYDITYTVKHNSFVGTKTIDLHASGAFGSQSAIPSTVGTHTIQYQATNNNPLFELMFKTNSGSSSGYIELDDVSVIDSDKIAPTPDPSTWLSVPAYINGDSVEMIASTATDDVTDIEYFFNETSGWPGGEDSGWQSSPYYMDDGLTAQRIYTYTVQVRDKATVANLTTASAGEDIQPFGLMNGTFTGSDDEWIADTQWVYGNNEMQAYGNSGQEELQQYFGAQSNDYYNLTYTVVSNTLVGDTTIDLAASGCFGLQNSIDSSVGTHTIQLQATNVPPGTGDLTFKMNAATTSGSIILDDIIIAASDKTTPDPDPATFSLKPVYLDGDSVHMHATPATDDSGPVEYFFNETSGNTGGDDSNWQISTDYVDSGLDAGKTYIYTIQSRDSALVVNTGIASSGESVTPWGLMNGTFTGSLAEWDGDSQWAYNNNTVIATGDSGTDELTQDFGAILNEWYRLKYTIVQNSLIGNATINLAATGCFGSENSIASNVGTHYMILQATNVPATIDLIFALNSNTTGGTITLDDVSISRNLLIPSSVIHGGGDGYRGRYSSRSSE